MRRRTLLSAACSAPLAALSNRAAFASTGTVRIVVPYAVGGPTDAMARVLQPLLQTAMGATIIVDNVPGAGGSIGAMSTLRAPADGKTLFLGNNGPSAVTPLILGKMAGFDPVADFVPVGLIAKATMMLAVSTAVPANDFKSFLQYAKANPGKLNFASAGVGSLGHLASEYLAHQAGLQMTHVAYKGQAPTLTALLTNEVQMLLTTPTGTMRSYIDDKRIKLIALTSETPSPQYPNTDLLKSQIPGFVLYSWFSLMAKRSTPDAILDSTRSALKQALANADLKERFNSFGLTAEWSGPDTVSQYIQQDLDRWGPIIREKNIQLS